MSARVSLGWRRETASHLGDARPSVAELVVVLSQDLVLRHAPHALLDVGVEVVMPSLAALLAISTASEVLGDEGADDAGLRLIATLNELPAKQPSAFTELGGLASLYGLRLGLGFGFAGVCDRRSNSV